MRPSAAFRLPPFSGDDPDLWLTQVQSACRVAGITDDTVKFDLLVANLPLEVARQVRDVIVATPPDYTALTTALRTRLAQSRAARLAALLKHTHLGDQRPSQLLLKMHSELGGEPHDSALLRTLFLQRLPQSATAALALLPEDTSLNQLAAAADRFLEASGPGVLASLTPAAAPPPPPPPSSASAGPGDISSLREAVESLTAQVHRLQADIDDRSRADRRNDSFHRHRRGFRSQSRPWRQQQQQHQAAAPPHQRRPSPPSQQQTEDRPPDVCFYHRRFGAAARRCNPPCSWRSGNDTA